MGLVWRGGLLLGTAGSQLRDVQRKQVTLGSCAGPCCELRGTGRPSCPLSQLLSPSPSHVLGTEGWDGAGLQAGAGRVWAWARSVLRDMGVGCRCRSPAWVRVAEGPGAQSTVVVRCHRRRASSWLCLPHPAPGCAFPTQRRHLRFCASHAVVLGGARGPWTRTRPAGISWVSDQQEHRRGLRRLAQGHRCSVTPGRPSWRLWLHRKAAALPARSFLEGLQTQDRGFRAAQWNPQNPETGKPRPCVGLRGWLDEAGVWGWRETGQAEVTGARSTSGRGGSEQGATWPGSTKASPEARTRCQPQRGLRAHQECTWEQAAGAGGGGTVGEGQCGLSSRWGPWEEDRCGKGGVPHWRQVLWVEVSNRTSWETQWCGLAGKARGKLGALEYDGAEGNQGTQGNYMGPGLHPSCRCLGVLHGSFLSTRA